MWHDGRVERYQHPPVQSGGQLRRENRSYHIEGSQYAPYHKAWRRFSVTSFRSEMLKVKRLVGIRMVWYGNETSQVGMIWELGWSGLGMRLKWYGN